MAILAAHPLPQSLTKTRGPRPVPGPGARGPGGPRGAALGCLASASGARVPLLEWGEGELWVCVCVRGCVRVRFANIRA